MNKKRTNIPQKTVDIIMVLCKRVCCWCEKNEATEIHHIDEDSSNNNRDNLFPCCSVCQKKFHTKTNFTRKITKNELKMRRDIFYEKQGNLKVITLEESKEIKPSIEITKSELIKNKRRRNKTCTIKKK
jgi:hypothetical protein